MLTDISFILGARDDGYMGDFIDRFEKMLHNNLFLINDSMVNCEIVVVDFNPIDGKYLYSNERLSPYLSNNVVKNIIVDRSVLIADGLHHETFYEYFAKNIGAKKSSGKMLFFTNADIIVTKEIIEYMVNELKGGRIDNSCYRCRIRVNSNVYGLEKKVLEQRDLYDSRSDDGFLVAGYSGDATFMHRNVFIKRATGYNEKTQQHRGPVGQSSMDGEILWNLHFNEVDIVVTDLSYFHVNHERSSNKDPYYIKEMYKNRRGWGFVKYPTKRINKNTIMLYDEENYL